MSDSCYQTQQAQTPSQGFDSDISQTDHCMEPVPGHSIGQRIDGGAMPMDAQASSLAPVTQALNKHPQALLYYEPLIEDPAGETRRALFVEFWLDYDGFNAMLKAVHEAVFVETQILKGQANEHGVRVAKLDQVTCGIAEAKVTLRDPANLTKAERDAVKVAVATDATMAEAVSFIEKLCLGNLEPYAKAMYDLVLSETKDENKANNIYTRLHPSSLSADDIAGAREAYTLTLNITLGNGAKVVQARTPYHISTRSGSSPSAAVPFDSKAAANGDAAQQSRRQVAYAKGSADETQTVVQDALNDDQDGVQKILDTVYMNTIKAGKSESEALGAVGKRLELWLSEQNIGVDCSGFVFNVTTTDPDIAAGWQARHPGSSLDKLVTDNANVSAMATSKNSIAIPTDAARSGDIVVNQGLTHVGVVVNAAKRITGADLKKNWPNATIRGGVKLDDRSVLIEVGIAHSIDANSSAALDAPGPHLATYWFTDAGKMVAYEESSGGGTYASFREFRRFIVTPVKEKT